MGFNSLNFKVMVFFFGQFMINKYVYIGEWLVNYLGVVIDLFVLFLWFVYF